MKVKSRKDRRMDRRWRYDTDQYAGSTLHYRVVAAVWLLSFAAIAVFSVYSLRRSGMGLLDLLDSTLGWGLDVMVLFLAALVATAIAALVFMAVGVLLSFREKWREWGRG